MTSIADLDTSLTDAEISELESLLDDAATDRIQSVTQLHGFFASIVSGPMVLLSEWMPYVFGDEEERAWESLQQAKHAMGLVMRFYNSVARELAQGTFAPLIDRIGDGQEATDLGDDWCSGYVRGVALRMEEWKPLLDDPEHSALMLPISTMGLHCDESEFRKRLDDPQLYEAVLGEIGPSAQAIWEYWRQRTVVSMRDDTPRRRAPKISPNAPCPCGSGKKFKRCCGPPTAARGNR